MHLKEVDANLLVVLDALLVDASVTRAAERLGRSASAISHALAKLREIFADELFVRAGQRLVPTAKALDLAPTVHVILAGMESLLRPAKPFDPSETERDFAVAASEVGELILVQPLRLRLEQIAPSVRAGWMPGQGPEIIDALRHGQCHFAIDVEAMALPAPDIHVLKLYDDRLATFARSGHPLGAQGPDAKAFAASDHIAVNALPTIALLDRELAKKRLACNISARVSSVLAGLLLTLDSDALLTLPHSLALILERQFPLQRVAQPLGDISIPVRLLWHSSYDRDECHHWVRDEFAALARESGRAA
jgi:DNA-binding transcriptional LysR family regulator